MVFRSFQQKIANRAEPESRFTERNILAIVLTAQSKPNYPYTHILWLDRTLTRAGMYQIAVYYIENLNTIPCDSTQ
jgi:hypothetical protein